jgi:hypothetical protein
VLGNYLMHWGPSSTFSARWLSLGCALDAPDITPESQAVDGRLADQPLLSFVLPLSSAPPLPAKGDGRHKKVGWGDELLNAGSNPATWSENWMGFGVCLCKAERRRGVRRMKFTMYVRIRLEL